MSDPITTEYLHESFLYFDGDLIWRKRVAQKVFRFIGIQGSGSHTFDQKEK